MEKYWNILFGSIIRILLTVLILPVNILCEEWIRIGVLGLFSPTEIVLNSKSEVPLDIRLDNTETLFMGKKDLRVKLIDDKLFITTKGANQDYQVAKSTNSLQIAAPPGYWDMAEFTITIPHKTERAYKGKLEILPGKTELIIINELPLEKAVEIITFSEMQGIKNKQLLSAFSIVVRSYLKSGIQQHPREPFDFCDNTHCQLYFGEEVETYPSLLMEETRNLVLTYNNEIIPPFYCHSCGGHTASSTIVWGSDYPYIIPVNCSYCQESNENIWETIIPKELVEPLIGIHIDNATTDNDTTSGITANIIFTSQQDNICLSGDDFRIRIGQYLGWDKILSNRFSVAGEGNSLEFRGKGKGHCLGMCLYGSRKLANEGRNYLEILSYYFPNAVLKNLKTK